MIGTPKLGHIKNAAISGKAHTGLIVTTLDGKPAHLAIIDDAGNILESGKAVAEEAMAVSLTIYRNVLQGNGHLRVMTPTAQGAKIKAA